MISKQTLDIHPNLDKMLEENYKDKILGASNFTIDEIDSVKNAKYKVNPNSVLLEEDHINALRELIRQTDYLTQTNIQFCSHRPYVGTIISGVKQLCWKSIVFVLKPLFDKIKHHQQASLRVQLINAFKAQEKSQ